MSDAKNVLVVEDESLIAEMIKMMLDEMGYSVKWVVHNPADAEEILSTEKPDFAIFDINLNGDAEGIELGKKASIQGVPFMYLTSYSDRKTFAKAKETYPGAFVIKPFSEKDLFTGIEMSLLHSGQRSSKSITVKDGHKNIILKVDEVKFLKADNIYVEVHTNDKKILSRQSLSTFLKSLPSDQFIRIHRSYAVNKNLLTSVSRSSVQIGDEIFPISRSYRDEVFQALKN